MLLGNTCIKHSLGLTSEVRGRARNLARVGVGGGGGGAKSVLQLFSIFKIKGEN